MGRFCINCGRPLEDGEVCTCTVNEQPQEKEQYQQEQSQGNGYYQQSQPQNNGYYQQGQPQNNGYYQQDQPQNNGYYQQGQPQNNGYYQQGQPQGNGYYQQGQPQGNGYYQQGRSPEMEWLNARREQLVSKTKNMFSEILPILKAPITRGQELARSNSSAVGVEFIVTKMILMILILIFAIAKLKSEMGEYAKYLEIPYVKLFLIVIIFTAGVDFLDALLQHALTMAFRGRSSFNMTVSVIGVRALYQAIGILGGAILALLSPVAGAVVIAVFSTFAVYLEHQLYLVSVENSEDRKLYTFFVEKLCLTILTAIIFAMVGSAVIEAFQRFF